MAKPAHRLPAFVVTIVLGLLGTGPKALASAARLRVAGVEETSRGDPKIFALMAQQDFESSGQERGSTLKQVCTVRDAIGRAAYDIYWLYHLAQGSQEAEAELVSISAAGNVLGAYDYAGQNPPTCAEVLYVPPDAFPQRKLTFDQIPGGLWGKVGAFTPAPRYEHALRVDGIWLPEASLLEFEIKAPPAPRPLPAGHRWGRCLLRVSGKSLISGRCAYSINKDGGFAIAGPQQVYAGLDYPNPSIMAEAVSRDYWAEVFRDDQGWTGYGNNDVRSVHGDRTYGSLRQRGPCFTNEEVRACLWRKKRD